MGRVVHVADAVPRLGYALSKIQPSKWVEMLLNRATVSEGRAFLPC